MTEQSSWRELSDFMDKMYLRAYKSTYSELEKDVELFAEAFLSKYPERKISTKNRILDLQRYCFGDSTDVNQKKLKEIYSEYYKIGFENLEREFDINIYYFKNVQSMKIIAENRLLSLIVQNRGNKLLLEKEIFIPDVFSKAEGK